MANGVINHIYVSIIKLHIKVLNSKTQGRFLLDEHLICWEGDGPRPREERAWKLCIISGPRPCLTYYIWCSSVVSFIKFIIISIAFSVCSVTHCSQVQNGGGYGKCRIYSVVSRAEVWVSRHPTCGWYLKGGQSAEDTALQLVASDAPNLSSELN